MSVDGKGIAEGRLKHGLTDFQLTVQYADDFGVSLGLKVSAARFGVDLGGEFSEYQATVWRISGTFGGSVLPQPATQQSEQAVGPLEPVVGRGLPEQVKVPTFEVDKDEPNADTGGDSSETSNAPGD